MEPVASKTRRPIGTPGLRNLAFMVWEDVVLAARVEVDLTIRTLAQH